MSDPLIAVDDAAAAMGKSREHVYRAIEEGHWWFLGAYKCGSSYVIMRAVFVAWLRAELVIGKTEQRTLVSPFMRRRDVA